jgi:DNA-binding Lrp family transcriptional regulator
MDMVDWQIVNLLSHETKPDVSWLAEEVGCSPAEAERRLAALVQEGILRGIEARVEPAKLGLPVTAFFMIRVAQNAEVYDRVADLVQELDQVEEAHAISGQFDWIIKVRAASTEDLQRLLTHRLARLPGFVRAESLVVLHSPCQRANVEAALHPQER